MRKMISRAPIKLKLMLLVTAVSAIALMLACVAFIVNDLISFKSAMVNDMTILTRITAANCQASVDFGDSETAGETLSALRMNPNVVSACIRDKDGERLARYSRDGGKAEDEGSVRMPFGAFFKDNHLSVHEPIMSADKVIGSCCIDSDLNRLYGRLVRNVIIAVLILGLATLLAFFLSSIFQKLISNPILHLLETTIAVSKGEKDYSHRAHKYGDDELGRLTDGFNAMMAEIEKRDLELEQRGERLEQEVDKRTAELSASNTMLQKEVLEHKRTEEKLKKAKEAAEAANRAKSGFLANMSHEIRTPMNAIIGLSHLALQTRLTPRQQDYQKKIHASANSLLRLINDILDFSKIEAGRLDMENHDFSLAEVLEGLASLINVKAAEKGLTFTVEAAESIPPRLVGDALRLGQVLTNLSSNAVKFTHEGGVSIAVEAAEESNREATLRFKVKDTGIGMGREEMDQLFRPFQQADASITRKYGGTGLGLAISKRLIEMMGGDIRIDSEPGVGTRFTFTARFGKSDREAPLRIETASKDRVRELLAGRRILLVEDNEINLQVASELLEQVGVRVSAAVNGEQAVELAVNERFNCILMDLHMPVMDGLTATREIRKGAAPPDLPIVAMTASAMTGDREECLAVGMNDHIAKPIQPANLYGTLIRWIRPDVSPGMKLSDGVLAPADADSPGPADDFPPLDGVDVKAGLMNMDGNRKLYQKVLESVYSRYRDIAGQIRAALDREDHDEAQRLAHTFKGLAGTIGARELLERSSELESAFDNKKIDLIPSGMASFSEEAKRVMAAMAALFREEEHARSEDARGAGEPEGPELERLKALLGDLSDMIDEGDSDALGLVEKIRDMPGLSGIADLRELESHIVDYEFEDAGETLNRISRSLGMDA